MPRLCSERTRTNKGLQHQNVDLASIASCAKVDTRIAISVGKWAQ